MDLLDTQIYEIIGDVGLTRLVAAFYQQVPGDDILGPMYTAADLAGAEGRLRGFLIQRFGGPDDYSRQRGHPRLRMRHAGFKVDRQARDRWISLMDQALEEVRFDEKVTQTLRRFFDDAATFMINHGGSC